MASEYGKRYPGSGSVIEADWKSGKKGKKKAKGGKMKVKPLSTKEERDLSERRQRKAEKQAKRETEFAGWKRQHRGKVIRSGESKPGVGG